MRGVFDWIFAWAIRDIGVDVRIGSCQSSQNFPPQSDPGLNDWSLDAGLKLNGVEEWSQIWSLGFGRVWALIPGPGPIRYCAGLAVRVGNYKHSLHIIERRRLTIHGAKVQAEEFQL